MNALVGHSGVILALAGALLGAAVIGYGLLTGKPQVVRSGQVYAVLVLAGAVIATIAMERALLTHDYSIVYVAENSSRRTPFLYTITGLWSALAGSLLLWGLVLAGYCAA
ncbi:MAG: heme lyase CcmF/NrfE family subunit, partial [Acidimicrobiales bacterium]